MLTCVKLSGVCRVVYRFLLYYFSVRLKYFIIKILRIYINTYTNIYGRDWQIGIKI